METKKQRHIKSGYNYDHLFPKANTDTHTIMTNAGVGDTVAFIPKVVNKTLEQTKAIAQVLKASNDYDTCRNIWQFVYGHIAYRKDKDGYEQIRSPARSWHDRRAGVDCDCYTTFISSILTNLGIPHLLRITKYSRDYFQHIYPVAVKGGKEIILDCVTEQFDYEVPYSEKKDYPMDLQYLDGLDDIGYDGNRLLDGSDEMAELGKIFKKKAKTNNGGTPPPKGKAKRQAKREARKEAKKFTPEGKKKGLKKVLNKVNKFNPATVALRNGVLASMKLNIGNVAKRLRWSYLTPAQAQAKGVRMDRWQKLVTARQKLENTFYSAGGTPANLKKAILEGKGNKDHAVHGLGDLGTMYSRNMVRRPMNAANMSRMSARTPLPELLGPDIFYAENSIGTLGELGEPVTAATITAASGVIAAIAGVIKKIGDIFGGKGEGSKDFDEAENAEAEKEIPGGVKEDSGEGGGDDKAPAKNSGGGGDDSGGGQSYNSGGGGSRTPSGGGGSSNADPDSDAGTGSTKNPTVQPGGGGSSGGGGDGGTSTAVAKQGADEADAPAKSGGSGGEDKPDKPGFWDGNKKWLMPVGIGLGSITLIALAAKMLKPATSTATAKPKAKAMHGLPKQHKNHRRKGKHKHKKVKAVAML